MINKTLIDELMLKYKVQMVGKGYVDCIVTMENAKDFILDLDKIGIGVKHISWWCHCTSENVEKYGCPHGLGGPKSLYYKGWFSELTHYSKGGLFSNKQAINYIFNEAPLEKYYSPCLVPSLWLSTKEAINHEEKLNILINKKIQNNKTKL